MSLPTPLLARALAAVAIMTSTPAHAEEGDPQIVELKRQLQERDVEIERLREQVKTLLDERKAPPAVVNTAPPPVAAADSTPGTAATGQASNEVDTGALERALVLQGGQILPRGLIEITPELFYIHDGSRLGQRRDTFGTSLTTRAGLPWSMQADLTIPFIVHDRWRTFGKSSGIGDVRLGLTKQLLDSREHGTAILVRGGWRLPTGSIKKVPPTGFDQHGAQVELTATKEDDPVVLFGSVSYLWNLGSARLDDGTKLDSGDVYGGRFGVLLAASPSTSLFAAVNIYASRRDQLEGFTVDGSDRLFGSIELGIATILARNLFLNADAAVGFTDDAPDLILSFSLPYRF